ncbi:hypothetical protein BDW67DRAFT_169627 [Aspergillus spinulosporus]
MWRRRSSKCGSLPLVFSTPADLVDSSDHLDPVNQLIAGNIRLPLCKHKNELHCIGKRRIRNPISCFRVDCHAPTTCCRQSHAYLFQISGSLWVFPRLLSGTKSRNDHFCLGGPLSWVV